MLVARLAVENRYLWKESGTVADNTREGEREDLISLRSQYSPPVRGFRCNSMSRSMPGRPTMV